MNKSRFFLTFNSFYYIIPLDKNKSTLFRAQFGIFLALFWILAILSQKKEYFHTTFII